MNNVPKDQGMWNALFSLGFLVLFTAVFWSLTDGLDNVRWIAYLTPFDITLLSLATFRMVRLLSYDKLLHFARLWFMDENEQGEWHKPNGGVRRTVIELLECIWCTGLWSALFVVTIYFALPVGRLFVIVLSVAAVGSFLQNFSQMIARIGAR
jgi:hypothetical protein